MKLLLIGPQGCGKGTIGKKLSQHLNIPLVSVGQILRDLPDDYPGKDEIENYVDKGELAPQNLVSEILKSEISKDIYGNGFIFDGWGRTLEDLDYFNPGFDKVKVDGELVRTDTKKVYIMINKPKGIITSVKDEKRRTTVIDLIKLNQKIFSTFFDKQKKGKLIHPKP